MPGPLGDCDIFLAGANLLHLVQGGAGDHKGEAVHPLFLLHRLVAQGQPVAVHRHHREAGAVHLKEGAGVDGPALVVTDGKEGLADHGSEDGLADDQGVLLVHRGQLGEFLRVGTQNVELGQAALDIHCIALGGEDHHVVGHLADNLTEEAGGQHQGTRLPNLGGDGSLDSSLQVVASEAQGGPRLDEDALHGGNGALGGHSAGGNGYRGGQQGLFTGEFHKGSSDLFLSGSGRRGFF